MPCPFRFQVPRDNSVSLHLIYDEFRESACPIRGDRVTCDSLARRWQALAKLECEQALSPRSNQAIALRCLQLMRDMDLTQKGWVSTDEWVHHGLLLGTGGDVDLVKVELSQTMQTNPECLKSVLHIFLSADVSGSGSISFGDLVALFGSGLFSSDSSKLPAAKLLTRLKLLKPEHVATSFAHHFLSSVGTCDGKLDPVSSRVNYTQFIAHCIGRDHSEVTLHLYDLSSGLARKVSPWLLGRQVEGIWHTGVVAFGYEFYFTHDCGFDKPACTRFGAPTRVIRLGHTLRSQADLHKYIVGEMKPVFHRDSYDVVSHNCNHFADRVCMFLGGMHLPDDVLQQPEYLLVSRAVRFAKPLMNWYLRDNVASRRPAPDVEDAEGAEGFEPPKIRALPPGSPVFVRPASGCAPLLGVVCSEGERGGAASRSAVPTVPVSYLDTEPMLIGAGQPCVVHTEAVPVHRLSLEKLGGALLDHGYLAALRELMPDEQI